MENRKTFLDRMNDRIRIALAADSNDVSSTSSIPAGSCIISTPVERVIHSLLVGGIESNTSEVHLIPEGDGLHVRFATEGIVEEMLTLPQSLERGVIDSIKEMADIAMADPALPLVAQQGLIPAKFNDKAYQVSVSFFPTEQGERTLLQISG